MSKRDLISLCREGDVDAVRQMIAEKCSVNENASGLSPLLVAIESDNRALALLLLNARATLQQCSPALSPLRLAVASGSAHVAELLITSGKSITIHDIVEAACYGHRTLVSLLISKFKPQEGASILHLLPLVTQPGKNPLHNAAINLIVAECPALINARDSDRRTPLQCAVASGNAFVVSALVKARADVNISTAEDGMPLLMLASSSGNVALVNALLEAGPALLIDAQNNAGNTALHGAAASTSLPVVQALLEARADVNVANRQGMTPLFYASSAPVTNALLDAGADINHRGQDGFTPILITNSCEVVATLINRNADVSVRTDAGGTVLMKATACQNEDVLRLLLATPATASLLNEQDSDGNTAIAHALLADVPLKIVRMLIAAGADLSIGNKNGSPPLSLVKSAETARALIDAGADCNQQSNIGWTPLAVACHQGLVDVATMLLTRSASIDISTNGGVTSLMLAAHQGHLAVVELMLLARSPTLLNARTQDGATALHIAVQKDFLRVVDVLLSAGADPNIADNSGSSPLIKAHRTEIARRLLDGGADVNAHSLAGRTALMIAARSDSSASLVALLLQRRADVAAADNNGYNSLMWAACKNHVDVMSLLLQAPGVPEAWVNAQAHDGSTTLTVASEHGATAAVKALIAAGADVHLATNAGCTALHLAGNVDIARLLWNAGAQDVPTNNGDSTLTYAVSWNKPDVVKFLLQCGLDVNEIHRNMTPMMRATACGHLDVLRVLLAADPPAEVDQHDEEGHTALFIAAQSKEPLAVKELLHAGASPRAASTAGTIPLMYCATPEAVKMLVDAAPGLINHTCSRGRGVLAYLTSKATLDELFASSARYNIQIDVDHADVKGDTALHMAMLSSSGPEAVKLLLEKGADVFSVGYGGMTVLMKPFLTDDVDVIEREYADLDLPDDSQGSTIADSTISDCLKAMLDHVVALEVGVESAPVRSTAKRGNHAAEIEGDLGNEQAAKRQRR